MRFRDLLLGVAAAAATLPLSAEAQVAEAARPERPRTTAYQGGASQTQQFSRKVKLGRDGQFSLNNLNGDITINAGSGDEVDIEATKHGRGERQVEDTEIQVDARAGRLDVRTVHARPWNGVSVTYTVTVPASTSIEIRSMSGSIRVVGVQGAVRAETLSGNITTSATPRLEFIKSVSGNIDLTESGSESELSGTTISGTLRARGLKARNLSLTTVSGDLTIGDVDAMRLGAQSITGRVEYSGTLSRAGRYDFTSHSGSVRLTLAESPGFDLTANTFSGSIQSELALTISADSSRRARGGQGVPVSIGRSMQASFGDASAAIVIRTFSGDIVIAKR